MFLQLLIRLAINLFGFSFLVQGKIAEGMIILVSGQLMEVQFTLDRIIKAATKKPELKKDE